MHSMMTIKASLPGIKSVTHGICIVDFAMLQNFCGPFNPYLPFDPPYYVQQKVSLSELTPYTLLLARFWLLTLAPDVWELLKITVRAPAVMSVPDTAFCQLLFSLGGWEESETA